MMQLIEERKILEHTMPCAVIYMIIERNSPVALQVKHTSANREQITKRHKAWQVR